MGRILTTGKGQQGSELSDDDILVMFPASRNYPKPDQELLDQEQPDQEQLDDPLIDLLNEYLDNSDDEETFEDESTQLKMEEPLEAELKRIKVSGDQSYNEVLLLDEVVSRMSYYLKEIEFYTKNR